jgi:hypothetical protein
MAPIKGSKRFIYRTAKGNGVKRFTSGLLFGLSSASLFLSGGMRAPKTPADGLSADWKAVGADIAGALGKRVG